MSRQIHPRAYRLGRFLRTRSKALTALALAYRGVRRGPELEAPAARKGIQRLSPKQYAAVLTEFIGLARARGSRVLLLSIPRKASVEERSPELLEYTRALETVGRELDVPVLDLRARFMQVPDFERELFLDSHHPNPRGQRLIATAIADHLCQRDLDCLTLEPAPNPGP